ncbi:hypothetical protein SUDANB15_06653 [Streptomyces sp. enrichment culture]
MPRTEQEAVAFVEHHIEVRNEHDLEEILRLCTEDAEPASPFAGQAAGSDVVRGREARASTPAPRRPGTPAFGPRPSTYCAAWTPPRSARAASAAAWWPRRCSSTTGD